MRAVLLTIFMVTLVVPSWATMILPMPLEKQLKSAHAVVYAKYQGKNYRLDRNGEALTDHSFQLIRSVGLTPNEIINRNDFRITVGGGVWQGVTYTIEGAPRFEAGEEVVLILSRYHDGGFTLHNFALGKYDLVKKGHDLFLSSAYFPQHTELGMITYDSFNYAILNTFGEKLTLVDDKNITVTKAVMSSEDERKGIKRRPASDEVEEVDKATSYAAEQGSYKLAMFWLAVIFAGAGAGKAFFVRKKR